MPRNVRNFWIEGQIDGRTSKIGGGPRNKDGGFDLHVYQRDEGRVTHVLAVQGHVRSDGSLMLLVEPDTLHITDKPTGFQIKTKR